MGYFNKRNVTVRVEGLAGLGIELGPGPGDSSIGATNSEDTETQAVLNRGDFDCATSGDQLQKEFSITVNVQQQGGTSAVLPLVEDFIMRRAGSFFAAVQSTNATDDVFLCRLIVTETSAVGTRVQTAEQVKLWKAWAEATDANTLNITGTIYSTIVTT